MSQGDEARPLMPVGGAPLLVRGDCPICVDTSQLVFLVGVRNRRVFAYYTLCGFASTDPVRYTNEGSHGYQAESIAEGQAEAASRDDLERSGWLGLVQDKTPAWISITEPWFMVGIEGDPAIWTFTNRDDRTAIVRIEPAGYDIEVRPGSTLVVSASGGMKPPTGGSPLEVSPSDGGMTVQFQWPGSQWDVKLDGRDA